MRIKVVLQSLQNQTIEINYNYYLTSLIYNILSESDVDFSAQLHSKGYSLGNKNFKLFCFSRLFSSNYTVDRDKLILRDKVVWYVSSPIKDFILHFADGLLKKQTVKIGEGEFYIASVSILKELVFTNEMHFRSLSPITTNTVEIVNGERRTVSCPISSPKFYENIKNNLIRKYFLLHGTLPENMSVEITIDGKYANDKGKLIKYKDTYIKGYQVPLTIKGDPKLIEVAYECGVGEKNSAGFGFIEVKREVM